MQTEHADLETMGSHNHSLVQANLIWLLKNPGLYSVFVELSLDVSQLDLTDIDLNLKEEIKPDICVYPRRGLSRPADILRMREAPLLAVEILSPRQGTYDILQKFKVYFMLGVRTCWLVDPALAVVSVYNSPESHRNFVEGEVESLDMRISVAKIFDE